MARQFLGLDVQPGAPPVFVYNDGDTGALRYAAWRLTPPLDWFNRVAGHMKRLLDVDAATVVHMSAPVHSATAEHGTDPKEDDDDSDEDDDTVTLNEALERAQGLSSVSLHGNADASECESPRTPRLVRRASLMSNSTEEEQGEEDDDRPPRRQRRRQGSRPSAATRRASKKEHRADIALAWVRLATHMPALVDDDAACEELQRQGPLDRTLAPQALQTRIALTDIQCDMLRRMDDLNAADVPSAKRILVALDAGAAIVYAHMRRRTSLAYELIRRCIDKNMTPTAWWWYAAAHSLDLDVYAASAPWAASILECALMLGRVKHYERLRRALAAYARVDTRRFPYALLASGNAALAQGVPWDTSSDQGCELICGAVRGGHADLLATHMQTIAARLTPHEMARVAFEMRRVGVATVQPPACVRATRLLEELCETGMSGNVAVMRRCCEWDAIARLLTQCEEEEEEDDLDSPTMTRVWERLSALVHTYARMWPPGLRKNSQRASRNDLRRTVSAALVPSLPIETATTPVRAAFISISPRGSVSSRTLTSPKKNSGKKDRRSSTHSSSSKKHARHDSDQA